MNSVLDGATNNTNLLTYKELPSWHIIKRSHEIPVEAYYLVFKPFDKNYDPGFNAIRHILRKLKGHWLDIIITREILASKVHYNVLLFDDEGVELHEKQTNRYYIFCQKLASVSDKHYVHEYMVKEVHRRPFYNNLDIAVYTRNVVTMEISQMIRYCENIHDILYDKI